MEIRKYFFIVVFLTTSMAAADALAECYGEGEYQVCSEVESDGNGNSTARSWDTDGNSYEINTETHQIPNGHETTTIDSDGNEYSIRTWTDSEGSHTQDSDGNVCTITRSGQMIGCE